MGIGQGSRWIPASTLDVTAKMYEKHVIRVGRTTRDLVSPTDDRGIRDRLLVDEPGLDSPCASTRPFLHRRLRDPHVLPAWKGNGILRVGGWSSVEQGIPPGTKSEWDFDGSQAISQHWLSSATRFGRVLHCYLPEILPRYLS
jgi:hypothetical protein